MNNMTVSEVQDVVTISLNEIYPHINNSQYCQEGWYKLLESFGKSEADDVQFPLEALLTLNRLGYTFWCISKLDERYKNAVELFICNVAESVLPIFEKYYPKNCCVRHCIEARRSWALGDTSDEKWRIAQDAAMAFVRKARLAARGLAASDTTWSDAVWCAVHSACGETALSAVQQATDAMERDAEAEVEVEVELGVTRTIEQWFVEGKAAIQKGKAAAQEKQIALFRDFCNLRGDYKKCIRNDDPVVPTMG